jgi:predicted ribosomally synthesized peptide with SipW-like signal peptide
MTDERFELTRRTVLGGLGAAGVASAGAGLGTTAYFSDQETFTNNQLVAGELDLMVDWAEHYSDWSDDENDDGQGEFDVVMTGGDPAAVPDGYTGLPTLDEPLIAVPDEHLGDFMANTAVEAYPDSDGDGQQDLILTRDQISTQNPGLSPESVEEAYRDQFAQVPDDLDRPVIELGDVKPGDFGEVTFSMHLFNNPGYLWFTGERLDASENGVNDPEGKDPDEEAGVVELLDAIQVAVWHDDGDNVQDPEELVSAEHAVDSPSTITLTDDEALIARGTLREVLSSLGSDLGIPLDGDSSTEGRDCYPNSTTRHVAFAWWVPADTGNEIQTDSVTFDLGFYTEQCRHNDGSGMPPETDDDGDDGTDGVA